MHKLASPLPRVLVLSSGSTPGRTETIEGVFGDGADLTLTSRPNGDLASYEAIILDGEQHLLTEADFERLSHYVESGGRILAIDAAVADATSSHSRLLGYTAAPRLPMGEFYGLHAQPGHDLLRRVRDEFPVVDAFAPLLPLDGDGSDILEVSVHFRNRLVLGEHRVGSGNVVVSALGATSRAFASPELQTLLRRAISRPNEGPARSLGVAIVGYGPLGGMGYTHSLAVRSTGGLHLASICDTNEARLQSAHLDFPEAHTHTSVDEVAADPEVDIAIVATPPSTHYEIALQLLRAGKHVVCEKPLCFKVSEADHLIETALSQGLVLTVNQNRRWDADFLTIRQVIADGMIGEVFNIETFVGSFEHPCREWHSESAISGGAEFDWGAHYIDWTLQLMGSAPGAVLANGHKRVWHDVTNLDQVRVRMLWEDGREAEFVHSDVAAVRRPKFYIQGTEGTLVGYYRPLVTERIEPGRGYVREEAHHAEAPADLTLVRYEPLGGGLREQRLSLVQTQPYAFYRNLADHLLLDAPPLAVDHHSTRRLISVLDAAHTSAEQGGRPVTPA